MLLLCIGLLLVSASAAFTGAVPAKIFGHDIFFLLDNAWRVLNGQRPHLDYTSAFGPVTFLVTASGLFLSGNSVNGVGYGSALLALVLGLWAYWLVRRRMVPAISVLASVAVAALAASPFPLGLTPFDSSHAMVYNRYGYAILSLILFDALLWVMAGELERDRWPAGISTGAAFALLLFLKASYFVCGLLLLASLFVFRPYGKKRLTGIALGFAATVVCFLAYLGFHWPAMLRDLRMAFGARTSQSGLADVVWRCLVFAAPLLQVTVFGWAVNATHVKRAWQWRLPLLCALIFGVDVLVLSSNAQRAGLPLVAFTALILLNGVLQRGVRSPALIAFGTVLFLPQFGSDLAGLAYGSLQKLRRAPDSVVRFQAPRLQPLILYNSNADPESNGALFTNYVNRGVALLQQDGGPGETVLTMDMTNPFPYALGTPPPRAGMASITYGITLDSQHHPTPERFFGNAALVMVPKRPAHDLALWTAFYRLYEAHLHQQFALAAENDSWWLWRKKRGQSE